MRTIGASARNPAPSQGDPDGLRGRPPILFLARAGHTAPVTDVVDGVLSALTEVPNATGGPSCALRQLRRLRPRRGQPGQKSRTRPPSTACAGQRRRAVQLSLLSENASSLSTATTSSLARYPPVGTVAVTRGAACRPPHRVLRFRPPVVGGMIGEASRAVKRRIGTTAWAVLEDVALNASLHDGRWVASTSVRQVATHLGLTPGTVARALACLCAAGLVQGEDRRDANTGRFSRSVYRLAPTSALSPCTDSPHTADPAMACEASERHEGREHAPPASTRTSTEPSTPL